MNSLPRIVLAFLACLLFLFTAPIAAQEEGANALVSAEAFLDSTSIPPGFGTPLTLSDGPNQVFNEAMGALDLTGLTAGSHTVYVRFQDARGSWSAPIGQSFNLTPGRIGNTASNLTLAGAEIQIDGGEFRPVPAEDGAFDEVVETIAHVESVSNDYHTVRVRFSDSAGNLSISEPVTALPGPAVTLSDTTLSFGNQLIGTSSAAQTVNIINSGTANLVLGNLNLIGENPEDFAFFTNNCNGATLTPNGFCSFSVNFTPTDDGTRMAAISVSSNAPGSPHVVELNGNGVGSVVDSDGDGLPDDYEIANGLNPNDLSDAGLDPDGDGLTSLEEFQEGTDPQVADTDGDGFNDGTEVAQGTDPLDENEFPPPNTPIIVQAIALDEGLSLDVAPSTALDAEKITEYRIEISGGGDKFIQNTLPDEDGTSSIITHNLTNGVLYLVEAFAKNTQGLSQNAAVISVTPEPAPLTAKYKAENFPYPLLLVHGYSSDKNTWKDMQAYLEDQGYEVYAFSFERPDENPCWEARELNQFIDTVRNNSGKSKVVLVGHSQGGIVARSYIQVGAKPEEFLEKWRSLRRKLSLHENECALAFTKSTSAIEPIFDPSNSDVAALITYGSPHNGADEIPLGFGKIHPLLKPGSDFLKILNEFNEFPFPEDLLIVNLIGKTSPISEEDCLISTASQDMETIGYYSPRFKSISRSWRRHSSACFWLPFLGTETKDTSGLQEALDSPILQITLGSPADIIIIAPNGAVISKEKREIWGSTYEEQFDEQEHGEDIVEIPFPDMGAYEIIVVPDVNASSTDTFSLKMTLIGITEIIAKDMQIQDIPFENFVAMVPQIVSLDIKPDSDNNPINLGSKGIVPVAILSNPDFDATTVDPTTVTLADAPVKRKRNGTPQASIEDVNGDGLWDLVVHFSTEALQLSQTATEAVLDGETFDGTKIRGVDTITVVP